MGIISTSFIIKLQNSLVGSPKGSAARCKLRDEIIMLLQGYFFRNLIYKLNKGPFKEIKAMWIPRVCQSFCSWVKFLENSPDALPCPKSSWLVWGGGKSPLHVPSKIIPDTKQVCRSGSVERFLQALLDEPHVSEVDGLHPTWRCIKASFSNSHQPTDAWGKQMGQLDAPELKSSFRCGKTNKQKTKVGGLKTKFRICTFTN